MTAAVMISVPPKSVRGPGTSPSKASTMPFAINRKRNGGVQRNQRSGVRHADEVDKRVIAGSARNLLQLSFRPES